MPLEKKTVIVIGELVLVLIIAVGAFFVANNQTGTNTDDEVTVQETVHNEESSLLVEWDKVHISDEDIANDDSHLWIEQELARVSREARQQLDANVWFPAIDIMFIFPSLMSNTHTNLVLKKPKTESSIRKVWIPKTVAYILREWKQVQDQYREYLGQEFYDYNLVLTLPNGRPVENRIMEKEFSKLREKAGLPYVVFHSLRHSSTTYKLMLSKGDIKSVQGDTGHATADMVTRVYAHVLDENRKENAKVFEQEFYSVSDLKNAKPTENTNSETDIKALLEQLQKSPELLAVMKNLLSGGTAAVEA